MNDLNYPYACAHLWYYLRVEHLTGEQIRSKVKEINAWLNETCTEQVIDWSKPTVDGKIPIRKKENWFWAESHSRVPMHFNIFAGGIPKSSGTPGYHGDWNEVSLSNNLRFTHKEDLLAFKLKFGINDNMTHPDMVL